MTLEQVRGLGDEGAGVVSGLLHAVKLVATDKYRISVSPNSALPKGVTVELTASDSSRLCASVKMHVAEGAEMIWITIGRGLEFEIPVPVTHAWQPFDLKTVEAAVEGLASAAIRGDVNETATVTGGEVVRSEGTVRIGANEHSVSVGHGRPGHKGEPETTRFEYQPYEL